MNNMPWKSGGSCLWVLSLVILGLPKMRIRGVSLERPQTLYCGSAGIFADYSIENLDETITQAIKFAATKAGLHDACKDQRCSTNEGV